jgi:capsid protein
MKKKSKIISGPKGQYDAVTGSTGAAGTGNKRRQAKVEIAEESGAAGQLNNYQRLFAINLGRDLERNYSVAKSQLKQFRNNVVGADAKIQVNTGDDFGEQATAWFNKKFFTNCDFRSTEDFSKITRNIATAKKREGDILVVFDDGTALNVAEGGTGKIITYDADQICEITKSTDLPAGSVQDGGIVRDKYGREIGYIVSNKRGVQAADKKDVTIFNRNPDNEDANSVKLIKSTFRCNQGRGSADMLSSIADLLDCYEMRSKELQSAKVAAALAGTIEREEAVEDFDDTRLDPTNENPDDSAGAANTLPEKQTTPANYERMEALTGGYFDYLAKGDKLTLHDIKRPNIHMAEFLDHVTDASGSVFGFAHA